MRKDSGRLTIHRERSGAGARAYVPGAIVAVAALMMIGCGSDRPTSPSRSSATTNSMAGGPGQTSPSSGTVSSDASPSGHSTRAARTATPPGAPRNFRISNRYQSVHTLLYLAWDAPSGWDHETGHHFALSYAGRTVEICCGVWAQSWQVDVSDLDLSPGHAYTFSLRAVNSANQTSAPAQLIFETTPPNPPASLRQLTTVRTPSGEFPDQISFSPGRDNSGIVRRYYVFLDGRMVDSFGLPGGTTQFSLFRYWADSYTTQPCGPTALQLRAEDSSFNVGPPSAALTVFFPEYENCPPPHREN
jgi:hypothetical protein